MNFGNLVYIGKEKFSNDQYQQHAVRVFNKVKKMLSMDGYNLLDSLDAVHKDENDELFKSNYSRNGWNTRTIRNINDWVVIIRYRRYKSAQKNKIKGVELQRDFSDLLPIKNCHESKIKEKVRTLYSQGISIALIQREFKKKTGLLLSHSTMMSWVRECKREINIDD